MQGISAMKLLLKREPSTAEFTKGSLIFEDSTTLWTLELPWKENQDNISCIPWGVYTCKRVVSPKFGNTFEVIGVPNREHILFHSGNVPSDTKGCILLGKRRGVTSILQSKLAMQIFLEKLAAIDSFEFKIL